MEDCVFCKIAKGEIPVEVVYQDKYIVVFPDAKPRAPVHLLLVPKTHVLDLSEIADEVVLKIKNKVMELAKNLQGYQILVNGGSRQEVKHLHFHLQGEAVA